MCFSVTQCTHSEIFSESGKFKPNLDCNYPFPIDSALNGILIVAKYIGRG